MLLRTCARFLFLLICLLLCRLTNLAAQDHTMWTNLGIYGGNVQDLAVDPENPARIYASTYLGRGLYRSQDGGATWQALEMDNTLIGEDTFHEQAVYAVAVAPSNPDIVWAAHNYWVAKSIDGGETWTHIRNSSIQRDCTDCGGSGDDWRFCKAVAILPGNPDVVYVGTGGAYGSDAGGAVYVTTDGGATWSKLNQGVNLDYGVEDLAIDPVDPDIIWAVTNSNGYGGAFDGTVYRSTNGGQDFEGIQPKPATGGILGVAPKPDDTGTAFVTCGYGIVQLNFDGFQWQASYPVIESRLSTDAAFAPSDAHIIYASWQCPVSWGGDGLPKISRGVFDGGAWTWETFEVDPQNATALNCLAVHPADAGIVFGGDNSLGPFLSLDDAQTWTPINQGLDAVIVYDVDVESSHTAHMLAASGSGLYERMDAASPWVRRHNGVFRAAGFLPSSGSAYLGGGYGYVSRTTDNGATWSYSNSLGYVFVHDIAVDPLDTDRVYITTGHYGRQVQRSLDGGATFSAVLDGANQDGQAYSMNKVVIDPHDRLHLLAAGGNFYSPYVQGDLWESPDGGDTWQRTGLTDITVNAVLVDPRDPDILYAGCGYSQNDVEPLVKTTDAGDTWQAMTVGLPNARRALYSIWGPSGRDALFAVGDWGILLRFDGEAWEVHQDDAWATLYGVFGLSPSDVYAVGDSGRIVHYDGQTWQPMISNTADTLYKVWAADAHNVYAVGSGGIILHYDGSDWSRMSSPTSQDLYEVRGITADQVFAAGVGGTLLYYDGQSWQAMTSGTGANLDALWPLGPGDVFCAGDDGVILHYDGSDWSTMPSNTGEDLWGLWGSGSDDVYAAGPGGLLLRYDGRQWVQVDHDPEHPYHEIWGMGPARLYLTDDLGGIWRYDGREITAVREQGTYNRSVTDLAFHRQDPDIIYAATVMAGVYITPNQAADWLNLGTPSSRVHALAAGSLYAATGGGMYQLTGTGVLTGTVSDADTLLGIDDARVTTDLGHQCRSVDGLYMMVLPAGLFDVYALADHYDLAAAENVTVTGSDVTRQDFALIPGGHVHPAGNQGGNGGAGSSGGGGYCFIGTLVE